jgi:hypothetical protein
VPWNVHTAPCASTISLPKVPLALGTSAATDGVALKPAIVKEKKMASSAYAARRHRMFVRRLPMVELHVPVRTVVPRVL